MEHLMSCLLKEIGTKKYFVIAKSRKSVEIEMLDRKRHLAIIYSNDISNPIIDEKRDCVELHVIEQ